MSTPNQKSRYHVEIGPNGPRVVDDRTASIKASQLPWRNYLQLMRLDRPIGILLLLWPTMAALCLAAQGWPGWKLLVIFMLGVVLTRSAGCVINDYADQWLDKHVARTRERPLATGVVDGKSALILFAILMGAAFLLVLLTNRTTVMLSFLALLVASVYPYCKRHTYYAQVVLGVAFSIGIPMAFTAHGQAPGATAWLLMIGNILWTVSYDTWYAMVDRDDDEKAGAKSTAILFGDLDIVITAILQSMAMMIFALAIKRAELSAWAYLPLLGMLANGAWQVRLAQTRKTANYFRAFLANQWSGLLLFAAIVLGLMMSDKTDPPDTSTSTPTSAQAGATP